MTDAVANGGSPRVVLLARAGKAADHLADALRQAGAELLIAADPAATDEAALRALRPQAVLVALEPSIEAALDKLDGLLTDPGLTVIFDEADVAAHRAGWDAARWVRHLSAKLRHDSNVLPPGAEKEHDLQPSPGQLPKPAAAYTEADLAAFTREAVALADTVPVDGTPTEPPPALLPTDRLPIDTALLDAIPAAPVAAVPPPLPPSPPPMPQTPASPPTPALSLEPMASPEAPAGVSAFDGFATDAQASIEPVSLEGLSLEGLSLESLSIDDAPTPAAAAPASIRADAPAFESLSLDAMQLESMQLEDMPLEGVQLDSVQLDGMQLDDMRFDGMEIESAELDSAELDGIQLEGMQLEGMQIEEMSLDVVPSGAAPELAPIRFDDDAFFLEELSATRPLQGADADAPAGFDPGFVSDLNFELDEETPAVSPPLQPVREPEDILSFEELVARSVAAATAMPAEAPSAPTPAPTPAPAAVEKPAFSLGDLSLAPVDEAPVVSAASAPSAPARDLSALEARISSLSLVDIDDGSKDAAPAGSPFALNRGVVVIEAGLGGPDPARQLLSAMPAEFPAVILVRLHLQGGRYDRLVAQMQRASALPVALAEAGGVANPGTIYFLPEGIGVAARGNGLGFIADAAPAAGLFAALPPADSAVVFLSGSDPQLIDTAMSAAAKGALTIAQSPEDCYDGTACAELRKRGAISGLPVELAGRLASRWPS